MIEGDVEIPHVLESNFVFLFVLARTCCLYKTSRTCILVGIVPHVIMLAYIYKDWKLNLGMPFTNNSFTSHPNN